MRKRLLVRYCGGCNPRYERTSLVAELTARFTWLDLVYEPVPSVDAALIICGCPAGCADVRDLPQTMAQLWICAPEELPRAETWLQQWKGEPTPWTGKRITKHD